MHAKQQWARHGTTLVNADALLAGIGCTRTIRKRVFSCVTCAVPHRMRLVETRHSRFRTRGHFRHPQQASPPHAGGTASAGESDQHLRAKALLQHRVGCYAFVVAKCRDPLGVCCEQPCREFGDDARVDLEQGTSVAGTRFVYDCVMRRNAPGGNAVVMEVWHTHETGVSKIEATRGAGYTFAEFDTADVMRLETFVASDPRRWLELENLKPLTYTCRKCCDLESYQASSRAEDASSWKQLRRWSRNSRKIQRLAYDTMPCIMRINANNEAVRQHQLSWDGLKEAQRLQRIKLPSAQFVKNLSQKCPSCSRWHQDRHYSRTGIRAVSRFKFREWKYRELFAWRNRSCLAMPEHVDSFCDHCLACCYGCGDWMPLTYASAHGLCLECNEHGAPAAATDTSNALTRREDRHNDAEKWYP